MTNLEELTLYFRIKGESKSLSPNHFDNEIRLQMPRLHTLSFYFSTEHADAARCIDIDILNYYVQQNFNNMKYGPVTSVVNRMAPTEVICHIFSVPFQFHFLQCVGKNIANLVFNSVTHLKLQDYNEYRYEFFLRLSRAFPFLQK